MASGSRRLRWVITMIEIIGPHDAPEFSSALVLKNKISEQWPDIVDSSNERITIIVAAKCFGCRVQDIDLVVIGNLRKPRVHPRIDGVQEEKRLLSFVWTVEVKGHPVERVTFQGEKVLVAYHGKIYKDATEQAFGQQGSLRDYLKRRINRQPFVTSLVWLENVRSADIPRNIPSWNVVGSDSTWSDFLVAAAGGQREWLNRSGNVVLQAFRETISQQFAATDEICGLFSKKVESTPLDRKRLERITKRAIDDQEYAKRLGTQLLLFRGRGGTGKTITLIRLALDLHINHLMRVLFLTYNVSLVADIRRTTSIIGAPFDADGPVVQVRTVQAFMLELMKGVDIVSSIDSEVLDNYEQHLHALSELSEAFSSSDLPLFDYVFIDEAQDWPEAERDIIFRLFGAEKVVVADGVDQLVRSTRATDWTARLGSVPKQVVPLRRSLRLKNGLASFANAFAEEIGLGDWSLGSNTELSGGSITVLFGPLGSLKGQVDQLLADTGSSPNYPVDSLVCVPYTSEKSGDTRWLLERTFNCGLAVWDGTDKQARREPVKDINQLRFVTFESCRGLEGWNTYCFQLDKLYDQKIKLFDGDVDLLQSRDEAAAAHAASWMMIPMTRAIDHLVLHVENEAHPLAGVLRSTIRKLGSDEGIKVISAG